MAGKSKKLIAVVLYPGITALDLVGSMETLIGLNLGSPYRMVTVGKHIDPIQTDTSLKVVPNRAFWEVPEPFGLIVPGGGDAAIEAGRDEVIRSYVQSADRSAAFVASIGTGSLLLAEAGLLKGCQATTHWQYAQQLEDLGAHYVRQRWVEDGKYITAAGVTAGIDVSLHIMAKLTSVTSAKRTQLAIEYDPQPPLGALDWEKLAPREVESRSASDQLDGGSIHIDQLTEDIATREEI